MSFILGVITKQWYTGDRCMDEEAYFRIYIDGEKEASLQFHLFLAHGIGKDIWSLFA